MGVISPPSYAQVSCGSGNWKGHIEVSSLMQCLGSLPETLNQLENGIVGGVPTHMSGTWAETVSCSTYTWPLHVTWLFATWKVHLQAAKDSKKKKKHVVECFLNCLDLKNGLKLAVQNVNTLWNMRS